MKIYFAGPDVFRPDAVQHGATVRRLAAEAGFEGLYPLDNEVIGGSVGEISRAIYEGNCRMVREADLVIANLMDFRGSEPDSGTVFEVGMAVALGTPVIAYAPDADTEYADRFVADHRAGDGLSVENFGLRWNLMISHGVTSIVKGDVRAAIECAVSLREHGANRPRNGG